jgi:hypothetical protein
MDERGEHAVSIAVPVALLRALIQIAEDFDGTTTDEEIIAEVRALLPQEDAAR